MITPHLCAKLDPARFPNISLQMAAILGFLLDRAYTTPALAELVVTPDGHVLARPAGEIGPMAYLAAEADLRANLRRLGMADGLDEGEWADYAARSGTDWEWNWAGRGPRIVRELRDRENYRLSPRDSGKQKSLAVRSRLPSGRRRGERGAGDHHGRVAETGLYPSGHLMRC